MFRSAQAPLSCLALICSLAAHAGTISVTDPVGGVRNFGNVSVSGPPAASTVTLTNAGSNTTVTGFVKSGPSCSEFAVSALFGGQPVSDANPAILGAGESLVVDASYDAANRSADNCTVTVTQNGSQAVSFQLVGDGLAPALQVTGGPLAFAEQRWNGGTSEGKNVTVTNVGEESVGNSNIQLVLTTGTHFSIGTISGIPIASGEFATVQVVFDPASAGAKTDTLTISLNNDGPADPNPTVTMSGTATQSTQTFGASPFDIGAVLLGASATADLSIGNSGAALLHLAGAPKAMDFSGPAAADFSFADHGCDGAGTCDPVPNAIDPAGSMGFALRCTPSAEGLRSATLTVRSDDPASPRSVTVNCTGVGTTIFSDGFEPDPG